jgi:hypothetical protein
MLNESIRLFHDVGNRHVAADFSGAEVQSDARGPVGFRVRKRGELRHALAECVACAHHRGVHVRLRHARDDKPELVAALANGNHAAQRLQFGADHLGHTAQVDVGTRVAEFGIQPVEVREVGFHVHRRFRQRVRRVQRRAQFFGAVQTSHAVARQRDAQAVTQGANLLGRNAEFLRGSRQPLVEGGSGAGVGVE